MEILSVCPHIWTYLSHELHKIKRCPITLSSGIPKKSASIWKSWASRWSSSHSSRPNQVHWAFQKHLQRLVQAWPEANPLKRADGSFSDVRVRLPGDGGLRYQQRAHTAQYSSHPHPQHSAPTADWWMWDSQRQRSLNGLLLPKRSRGKGARRREREIWNGENAFSVCAELGSVSMADRSGEGG